MPAASVSQHEDRSGNAWTFATVIHSSGTASTFGVDQSAVSVADSAASGVTTLATEASPSAGVSLGSASSGIKTVTIDTSVASGTYHIVVRHQGSAAGISSSKV